MKETHQIKYNFTLIIPTHNRHRYLKRSFEYFKDLDATVIIADSSEIPYQGEIFSNISYLHLLGKSFPEKILVVLDKIKTDYVALCADDDFIMISSLDEGIQFLENNKDFSSVFGRSIHFHEKFDQNFYRRYNTFPQDINLDPPKNAEALFTNYYQILWAMYKKNILVQTFNIITKANFENDNFIELVLGGAICNSGGLKFLDSIWSIRQISEGDHWGKRHYDFTSLSMVSEHDLNMFKKHMDNTFYKGYSQIILDHYLQKPKTFRSFIRTVIEKFFSPSQVKMINQWFHGGKSNDSQPVSLPVENLNPLQLKNLEPILKILNND